MDQRFIIGNELSTATVIN